MISFEKMPPEAAKKIRYILHDIDDTITNEGKLKTEPSFIIGKMGSRRPSGTRLFLRRMFQRSWKR